MAPRKKKTEEVAGGLPQDAYIAGAGMIVEQPITETLAKKKMEIPAWIA